VDRTYISAPGLRSNEVGSFFRSLTKGGADVFVSEDLQRAFNLQTALKTTRRLGKAKLEEPKTEVPVKEEIYDEEEVDENEDFEEEDDELSDDDRDDFLEDPNYGEDFETNDIKEEDNVEYHPDTASLMVGGKFSCETCGKLFKTRKCLKRHSVIHLSASHPCETCGKCFKTGKEMRQHALRHNDVRHPCEQCGKDFNTPRDLRKHVARHIKKKLIACPVCSRSVISNHHLELHMRTHDRVVDESDTFCNICSKSFVSIYNLKLHMQTHSEEREKLLCTICSKLFVRNSFKKHMKDMHGDIKYAECEYCGSKVKEAYMKQHQQLCKATDEERAALKAAREKGCDKCGKVLSSNSKLKRHMKICK